MKNNQGLDRLFNPDSIAFIGVSKDERKTGGQFLKSLIKADFKGKLYPVNPNASEIMGLKAYQSIMDIPGEVDLAIITVPARYVPPVMDECSRKKVRFAVVHSAGFSELGEEGKALEAEMLRYARLGGIRIIGPNCMGLYTPKARLNTIAYDSVISYEPGSVAFVGQSGWATENVILLGQERGLRFSQVVSIGNQSDLTFEDLFQYFAEDKDTRVIAAYIEGIKRGREFLQLAREISRIKPIVIWKGGRSEVGIRTAASHTGSLAGNNIVVDAALRQGGIVIARNLEELVDNLVGFASPFLPRGNKLGLLVEAGGSAVSSADAAEALGLELPTLSADAQQELVNILEGKIPPFSRPKNPVDIVWSNTADLFTLCSQVMLKEVDALVIVNYESYDEPLVQAIARVRDSAGKPIFIVPGHSIERRSKMAVLTQNGLPTFTIPERALGTIATMARYSNYRQSG